MGDNIIFLSNGQSILENSSVYDITQGGLPSNDSGSSGSLNDWQTGVSDVADIFRTGAAGVRDTIDILTGKKPTNTVTGNLPAGATGMKIDIGFIAMAAALYWLVKHG